MKTDSLIEIIKLKKEQLEKELQRYPIPILPMISGDEAKFYITRYTEIAAKLEVAQELLSMHEVMKGE